MTSAVLPESLSQKIRARIIKSIFCKVLGNSVMLQLHWTKEEVQAWINLVDSATRIKGVYLFLNSIREDSSKHVLFQETVKKKRISLQCPQEFPTLPSTASKNTVAADTKYIKTPTKVASKKNIVVCEGSSRPNKKKHRWSRLAERARVYLFLILNRYVPNLLNEIELVLRIHWSTKEELTDTQKEWNKFSQTILLGVQPLLLYLGQPVLVLLKQIVPQFLDVDKDFTKGIEDETINTCNPSSKNGQESLGKYVAIPFCETTDSRHNYSTPYLTQVFTNRERTRDSFLSFLREFYTNSQSQFSRPSDDQVEKRHAEVVSCLMKCNYEWFANFFTIEILQVGLCPLVRPDISEKLLGKNKEIDPEKLIKLERRFSTRQKDNLTTRSSQLLTSNNPSKLDPTAADNGKNTAATTEDPWLGHFDGTLEFFYVFLKQWDSYRFNYLLLSFMSSTMQEIIYGSNDSIFLAINEPEALLERVKKLKVLARFIAYLSFSPLDSKGEMACSSSKSDSSEKLSRQVSSVLNVKHHLDEAIRNGTLCLNLPWVCEYMALSDLSCSKEVVANSTYFNTIWGTLSQVYRQCLAIGISISHLHLIIRIQLETLFEATNRTEKLIGVEGDCIDVASKLRCNSVTSIDERKKLIDYRFLYQCSPRLEQFASLIKRLRQPNQRQQPIQKLRPLKVVKSFTTTSSAIASCSVKEQQSLSSLPLNDSSNRDKKLIGSTKFAESSAEFENARIQLRNVFFKNHPRLRGIALTVIEQVLGNACLECIELHVKTGIENLKKGYSTNVDNFALRKQLYQEKGEVSRKSLETFCYKIKHDLSQTLHLLMPYDTISSIKSEMVNLSIANAKQQAIEQIQNSVMKAFTESAKGVYKDKFLWLEGVKDREGSLNRQLLFEEDEGISEGQVPVSERSGLLPPHPVSNLSSCDSHTGSSDPCVEYHKKVQLQLLTHVLEPGFESLIPQLSVLTYGEVIIVDSMRLLQHLQSNKIGSSVTPFLRELLLPLAPVFPCEFRFPVA